MPITGLHLLLTYQCNFECDHCFVFSGPHAKGVMKIADLRQILDEADKLGYIEWIYFEGGEPFLYYQTMVWGLQEAKKRGYKIGVVTNSYWATSIEDAKEWLRPISDIGIDYLSVSDDIYHYGENSENLAKYAYQAATELGLPVGTIELEDIRKHSEEIEWKGKPVEAGNIQFKGRAVEKLTEGMPRKPWTEFTKCLDEDFANQGRVHIDPFGYVHLCQGITMGNIKQTPMHKLFESYDPESHAICGPLMKGGPVELIKKYQLDHEDSYIDECHLCYSARLQLREKFPEILAPGEVYGIQE
jgi:MoaA/NifB/PqqE/SkfB family radical SAM enzyme